MQQNKTNNYVYYFVYFLLYLFAINADGITPVYLIQTLDEIQSGNIVAVTYTPSGVDPCAQAVAANRVQLRRATNFVISPERPQSSSHRPNTSPHAKHALAKRAQSEYMVQSPLR